MGTSFANHLAMAALLNPGDEVLIEQPVYDPLLSIAQYLRTTVKRFQRRAEQGFRIDIAELERQITPNTKLIVLTNLHNPSSALTDESTLRQIQDLAGKVGARVLVDEVYLEVASVMGTAVRPSFHLGPEFVVTTSLTKAYGLSGVRCGWIVAEPELARKLWQLQDLYYATPPHIAERLSVIALQQLDQISARARSILSNNRVILDRFLDARSDLFVVRPEVPVSCSRVWREVAWTNSAYCCVKNTKPPSCPGDSSKCRITSASASVARPTNSLRVWSGSPPLSI